MAQESSSFVVLKHEAGLSLERTSQTHLDWMFEMEGRLRTFATEVIDPLLSCKGITAIKLSDHRLHYLDFEGDVSGGRGTITRIARGRFDLIDATETIWHARLYWSVSDNSAVGKIVAGDQNYLMRSEVWFEDVRGTLQLRLSAIR